MLLELYGVITIFLVLLFAYAEIGQKKKPVGVFASLLLLLTGLLFFISDVHYISGSTKVAVDNGGGTVTTVETPTVITATLPSPPFPSTLNYTGLLGTSALLLSLWSILHYSDEFVW